MRIERGFVRPEDEPESKSKTEDRKNRSAKDADGLAPLSEKLVAELSAQAADNIARMKKQAMAEAAVAALGRRGWLPALLRREPDQAAK